MAFKDQVGESYIENMKLKHSINPFSPEQTRKAIVVGNDGKSNIGHYITSKLLLDGYEVVSTFLYEDQDSTSYHQKLNVAHVNGKFFQQHKDADTLVLCNGSSHMNWIEHQNIAIINNTMNDVLIGSMNATSEFVRATIDSSVPKYIVFIGSMAYKSVLNGSSVYCAAKAGLAHFMKCCAWELAPKGYRVFCVHPSNTLGTPMTEETIRGLMRYRGLSREAAEAYWNGVVPMDHILSPGEIAQVVSELVSGRMDYMSGTNVELAGGQR